MKGYFSRNLLGALLVTMFVSLQAWAEEAMKPFILGNTPAGDRAQVAEAVEAALTAQGFTVVGKYSPYTNATIIAVTNDELKAAAAKNEFGGYAAAQRVTVTEAGGKIQVAYTNPTYMAAAYRMKTDLSAVKGKMEAALGKQADYGSADGVTEKKLRKYKYMIGMERFDSLDKHLLTEYPSHQEALKAVDDGLAAKRGGVEKVYRVDVPGKDETIFGVWIKDGEGGDKHIMDRIDFADVKSTPHLPYEVLVSGNNVYHLFARFRIAINFPDLSMMGSNSFMSIMSAPGAIQKSLTAAVSAPAAEKKGQ